MEWLRERLKDGFHVHHIDGDHTNDAPKNLVLIDGVDHMRLHGMVLRLGAVRPLRSGSPAGARNKTLAVGQEAYYARKAGKAWKEIGGRQSLLRAKVYARASGEKWPIPTHS